MKRLIGTLCALLLLTATAGAQTKVIQKSSKKMPSWVGTVADDHLVVSVVANTLAEAQDKAMTEVTERIIEGVASHVAVTQTNQMSEVNVNGNIDSRESYDRLSKIKSANLPFLKGISSSKIEAVYWEKVQDKSTKRESYNYSVLYPFSDAEHSKLLAEFEALDAEKVAEYKALEQKINEIEAVEEIKSCITQLTTLEEYFFDEVRLTQVTGLKTRYKQLYDALSVVGTFVEDGKYQCQVLLEGSPVRVSVIPKVTSNCAAQLSAVPTDGMFIVTYDAIDCLPEEENFLSIVFRIDGKKLEHKAYLADAQTVTGKGSFCVVPEGKLILTADSVDAASRKVFNLNIRLTLNNRGGTAFGLKSIELHVPDFSAPIVFDDIDGVYKTKGVLQIKALAEGEFTALQQKKSALSFVQGSITFVNPETGAVERTRLSLPYVTNFD
ncbi:MAG: plethodontid receptivity factor PRF [Bacteroides sp.]|nr:plethodontid receptivity factor PRF [Bacteroides sp.]